MQATMDQMSVWMLISHASVLVKVVMLILVLSSVVSWYLIVRHGMLLRGQEQLWNRFLKNFRQQKISIFYSKITNSLNNKKALSAFFNMGWMNTIN